MLHLKYLNSPILYKVGFFEISENIIELSGNFPIETSGFILSRIGYEDNWDYSKFTTVYRMLDNCVQFSNNESVYENPELSEVADKLNVDSITYEPTIEEIQESKIREMNAIQQKIIQDGVDVTLTKGNTEHFTLTDHDQISLMGSQAKVALGDEKIPWHTSDKSEHCKFYSYADMDIITKTAMKFVIWHVTYFRDLRIYIRSLETKKDIENVMYGMNIPVEYQSEPLQSMILEHSN